VFAPDLPTDQGNDSEFMYLSTQNLAEQQQSFDRQQRRPPSTGSRGSRNSQHSAKRSASSVSSLRSSIAGLPEVSSISFIFNGYSEGFNIVELTLRFDTLGGKSDDAPRLPEMKHWIRSKCWDAFRNWVQTETQRCCASGAVGEVRAFEGPLEFYYPGQPDMTLVSGSVNVVRIQGDGDGDSDDEEEEEEEEHLGEDDPEIEEKTLGVAKVAVAMHSGSEQAGSGTSTDSLGANASVSPPKISEATPPQQEANNPFFDGDVNEEVDALLVEVECKAFSQYRSLNNKTRHSKRYGHLRRQPPLEPRLDAIEEI